jgi:predicted CDP-diglyceride synthetase/phosphatidate cytidylyltransferase
MTNSSCSNYLILFSIRKYLKGQHIFFISSNAGGVLDRADSYVFTGALAYSFVKTFLPLYGV